MREVRDTPLIGPGFQLILDRAQAELDDIQKRLERLGRVSEASGRSVGELTDGSEPAAPIEIDDAVNQHMEKLFAETKKVTDEIKAANEAAQAFVATEAFALEKARELGKATAVAFSGLKTPDLPAAGFEKTALSATKLAEAELAVINNSKKLEQQLQALIKADKQGLFTRTPKAIEALRKELAAAGLEVNKFGRITGRIGQGNKVSGFLRNLSGAFDRFGQSVEEATGIAESDFAILLGAGLAGGFAGVIRIVQKLTGAISEALGELGRFNRDMNKAFGEGRESIERFSTSTANSLGISTHEAQKTALAFKAVAVQLRLTERESNAFVQGMTALTAAVEASVPGINSTEEAQELLTSAVEGSDEALKRLFVTITDLNVAARDTFGRSFSQLSENQQIFIRQTVLVDKLKDAILDAGRQGQSFGDIVKNAGEAIGNFFAGPDQLEKFNAIFEILDKANQRRGGIVGSEIDQIESRIKGLSEDQLLALRKKVDLEVESKDERIRLKKIIDEELKALRDQAATVEKYAKLIKEVSDVHQRDLQAFRDSKDLQRQALDAQRAIAEATLDGNRRVEDAEVRLQRTREDNARKFRDLNIQSARSIEDAITRVTAAELELIDNQNDAQDRVEDAIDRIADAKKQSERAIRDINERIFDKERDYGRKVEDIQRRIADAHKDSARAIVEALLDVEAALRGGSLAAFNAAQRALTEARGGDIESVRDAERDLFREQQDHELEMDRLRRDLREARMDGNEAIFRAERDLDRARRDNLVLIEKAQIQVNQAVREEIRAREDAIRALSDLEVEQNRALRDAKRALEEAEIARERAINSAIRSFERLAENIGLAIEEIIDELIRLGLFTNEQSLITGSAQFFPGNAHGGPVNRGQIGWVGEQGPELFIPNQDGQIISNDVLQKLIAALMGSDWPQGPAPRFRLGGGQPTFNVYESVDPRATAFAIATRLAKMVNN